MESYSIVVLAGNQSRTLFSMYNVYVKATSKELAEKIASFATGGGVEIFFTSVLKRNSNISTKLNKMEGCCYLDRAEYNWTIITDRRKVVGTVTAYRTREDKIKRFLETA